MIFVNDRPLPWEPGMRVAELAARIKPGADVVIVNGFPALPTAVLADGDHCWLIRRGEVPSAEEMDHLLHARHTPGVHEVLKRAAVGIMGLGGLGSPLAAALARMGVGRLLLADYDVVEPSNLNRQHYFIDQIGLMKTAALKATLARINPHVVVECLEAQLTEADIPKYFAEVDVLAECFDDPATKAAALRSVLRNLPGVGYVGSSGVAGHGDSNAIRTRRLRPRVYVVGDGESAAQPGQGLMAPRVGIAAHHQANQVIRLLLGVEEER
ncbi:MAG: sulfur carrier protein ThiS adenylyltransferase ThiF [Thermodesulfobacteriota bacterium]